MTDDPVMVELVEDELRRASDVGELRSRAALQEALGMGSGDLDRALDALRDRGAVSEVEPDGFRLGVEEPPGVAVPDRPGVPEPGVSLAEAEARAKPRPAGRAVRVGDVEFERVATVTMPRAMIAALDANALGALLIAGIEAAPEGEAFVFEVTP